MACRDSPFQAASYHILLRTLTIRDLDTAMGTKLVQGQNAKLNGLKLSFTLSAVVTQSVELDASAVLLDTTGKVTSDRDFVFFNQPRHPSGALTMESGAVFQADLARLPANIHRLAFVLTVGGGLSALQSGYAFTITTDRDEGFSFEGQGVGRLEKSLIVCEVYRRGEAWKVKAIDQGFAGGMGPLAKHFGITTYANGTGPA